MRWALLMSPGFIFGLRPPLRPLERGGGESGPGAFSYQRGFVCGHQSEHAKDELSVRGGTTQRPICPAARLVGLLCTGCR